MQTGSEAVVLLGHGSRLADGNRGLERVAAQVAERLGGVQVEVAFLQLAEPDLDAAVARCAAAGAEHIAVVPFFLFPGAHVQEDIPQALQRLSAVYPRVTLRLAEVLGDHPKLAEVAVERAREALS